VLVRLGTGDVEHIYFALKEMNVIAHMVQVRFTDVNVTLVFSCMFWNLITFYSY